MNKYQVIGLTASVAVILLLFPANIWIAPLIAVFLAGLYTLQTRFIIIFSIVSFLTFTSTIDPRLRMAVQLLNIGLLLYIFLKDQDLKHPILNPMPKGLLYFLSFVIFWMIVSSLFSTYTKEGLEQVLRSVIFLPVIYLFYSYLKSTSEVRIILFSLVSVAVFYSIFLFYQLYQNNFVLISVEEQLSYVFGMQYLDKNFLGGFISMMILVLLSYFFYSAKYRQLTSILLIICFAGILLSNSRAAIISLMISFFVLLWMFNKKAFKRGIIITAAAIIIFFLTPLYDYFFIYARFESMSSGRDYLITAAEEVIKNNFLTGAGPSGTRFEMYKHLPFMLGSPEELFIRKNFFQSELGQAHSFYLFYFTDLGIIGFIISLLFPVFFFRYSYVVLKYYNNSNTEEYFITRAVFAIGVLMFIRGILEWGGIFTFGNFNQDLPFWLIFSIIIFYYVQIKSVNRVLQEVK